MTRKAIAPDAPQTVEELEDNLSTPNDGVVTALAKCEGDLLLLGAGGKMGPTLARMAARALRLAGSNAQVIAASRFSDAGLRDRLENWGVRTLSCDLLDSRQVADLPDTPHVIYMTGMKFGATGNPGLTWAMNCLAPAVVCEKFSDSRLAIFSSGNVYGLTSVDGRGSAESDQVRPTGEYAMSVLGRERMFEYFSRKDKTPIVTLRLNYATELRYGVLVDLARRVWNEESIDISMGRVNVIWQTDANAVALQSLSLASTPPKILNIAGTTILQVRDVAERFAELFDKPVTITGREGPDALLSNAEQCHAHFGAPAVEPEQMIRWTADWVQRSGAYLGKPTHFENRAGAF